MSTFGESQRDPAFPTTHWSRVIRAVDAASPDAQVALESLCAVYWYPLYAFIRHRGHAPDAAADLVQGLFAHILEHNTLAAADPRRGRFRTFLLAVCRHFLADQSDERLARKRGGGRKFISIDTSNAESRYRAEPADALTAERLFEHAWALAMLERVLGILRQEYEQAGKGTLFQGLEPSLAGGPGGQHFAAIAKALGMTAGAVQTAAHRLRRRYRELVRDEIASTIDDPAEIDAEIRDLFAALASWREARIPGESL
jgi:DNA-directed RNA polymerase specialized sigma24 family protein